MKLSNSNYCKVRHYAASLYNRTALTDKITRLNILKQDLFLNSMCLILFAFQHHSEYPLIVASNRDETYLRPTASAHFWPDQPSIFAGRDLEAEGTWMGMSKNGRFAAVTNVRETPRTNANFLSRGELTTAFLNSTDSAEDCLAKLQRKQQQYAGFNLLAGVFSNNNQQLYYLSNRKENIERLSPGVHGLSNGFLNEPWPKVTQGKHALEAALGKCQQPESLLPVLLDRSMAPECELPATGVDQQVERHLSSRFITSDAYGTRASTILTLDRSNSVHFYEQEFLAKGDYGQLSQQIFSLTS